MTAVGRAALFCFMFATSALLPVAQAAPAADSVVAHDPPQQDGPVEHRLGQRLRCPVCQGMSIGDSPAPMAQDMMRQVRRFHREGKSEEEIVAYFTERYGAWVMLDPPKEGFALWVWLTPPAALLLGFVGILWRSRQLRNRRGGPAADGTAQQPEHAVQAGNNDDPYVAAIRREVQR